MFDYFFDMQYRPCTGCPVLIRVSTILICLRASDKSKDMQVEFWSIGQAITPMQNMECREAAEKTVTSAQN